MTKFYNYLDAEKKIDLSMFSEKEKNDMVSLLELSSFMNANILNEGFEDIGTSFKDLVKKVGLHIGTSKGLIGYLASAGKNISQLFWYALKAGTGDEDAKIKLKEIANKEIKKEDVLDFLLKLDMATLHAVTGPIHLIDAITGWHLWANVKQKSADIITGAKVAIENLENVIKQTKGKIKKTIETMVFKLKKLLTMELSFT